MIKPTLLSLAALYATSCSLLIAKKHPKITPPYKAEYALSDKTGTYVVKREAGLGSQKQSFVVKESILPEGEGPEQALEKVVAISKLDQRNQISLFRPTVAQYSVWFDGKKYFSETKVDEDKKVMRVKLISSEKQWSGTREFPLPKSPGLFCYFLQIIECANYTGFIREAIRRETGQMNFHVIWEGYPYFQEQYLDVPDEPFSEARLSYDSTTTKGEHRFSLDIAGQVIFYFVDDAGYMTRKLWISQGYSLLMKK